ncbi:hypothetical protein AXF42_Ash006818 [Apostasia shenzhenica]|uniref:DUF7880 domain-containing protein n=1 Tax=Apostasia shenzhenica TaxID=1088818 RepID=A0A2I0AJH0_9ASPA|nr:hypothetical protein AXF42_Ash006818 [Apostasia shenzhenica]
MASASLGVYRTFHLRQSVSRSSSHGRRHISVKCLPPSPRLTGFSVRRRSASLALLFLHCRSASLDRNLFLFFSPIHWAERLRGLLILHTDSAPSPRKKLDPLEAYVPAVLLTEAQFKDLEKSLDVEQPNYGISRALLRSGPAASLRVNIRAVAQYADEDGKGKIAFDAVDRCLRALEDLDSLMLHASRNDPTVTVQSMKSKINVALESLDSLLQTVPSPVLDKGKAVADAYTEDLDPESKNLKAIL